MLSIYGALMTDLGYVVDVGASFNPRKLSHM